MHEKPINRRQWPFKHKASARKRWKSLNLNILLLPPILWRSEILSFTIHPVPPSHWAIKWTTIKYLFLKYLKYCLRSSIKNINKCRIRLEFMLRWRNIFNTQDVDFFINIWYCIMDQEWVEKCGRQHKKKRGNDEETEWNILGRIERIIIQGETTSRLSCCV